MPPRESRPRGLSVSSTASSIEGREQEFFDAFEDEDKRAAAYPEKKNSSPALLVQAPSAQQGAQQGSQDLIIASPEAPAPSPVSSPEQLPVNAAAEPAPLARSNPALPAQHRGRKHSHSVQVLLQQEQPAPKPQSTKQDLLQWQQQIRKLKTVIKKLLGKDSIANWFWHGLKKLASFAASFFKKNSQNPDDVLNACLDSLNSLDRTAASALNNNADFLANATTIHAQEKTVAEKVIASAEVASQSSDSDMREAFQVDRPYMEFFSDRQRLMQLEIENQMPHIEPVQPSTASLLLRGMSTALRSLLVTAVS